MIDDIREMIDKIKELNKIEGLNLNNNVKKIIQIVESRGMFTNYQHLIEPIVRYVADFVIKNSKTNGEVIKNDNGIQMEAQLIENIDIPQNLLSKIEWVEKKRITINVFNMIVDKLDSKTEKEIIDYKSGTYKINISDKLSQNQKLESININITVFAVNGELYKINLYSTLYHEITHAFENYNRLLKFKTNSFVHLSNTNYEEINKTGVEDEFNYLNYYLINQLELNANIAGVYGDLQAINSERKNFNRDIKNTRAYQIYNSFKNDILPNLIKKSDEEWLNFSKTTYLTNKVIGNNIQTFKKEFIKYADFKLNDLLRGIGKVSSQYYDDKELKNTINKKEIILHNK